MLAVPRSSPTEAVKVRRQANVLDVDEAVEELLGRGRPARKPSRAPALKSAPAKPAKGGASRSTARRKPAKATRPKRPTRRR